MPNYSYSLYGMGRPTGIAVTPDGSRIYVTQTSGEDAVLMLDGQGQLLATLQSPDPTLDHVFVYVAVNPLTAEVYVSDRPTGKILIFAADGTFLRTFEPPSSLRGWQPLGLDFTADGHLLVTDLGINEVYELDANGQLLRTFGTNGMFSYPNAAVVDAAGRLYVSDSNNGRLVVFGRTGEQIGVIRRGAAVGDLGLPRGLAIDDQGSLYVVDNTDHTIKVYKPSGDPVALPEFQGSFGQPGIGEGMFRFPNAVDTDTRGRVYVADWSNDRIQVWSY
jgi:DNA-binding beta-propeller fold protein YncE